MGIWNVRGRLSVTANITGSQQWYYPGQENSVLQLTNRTRLARPALAGLVFLPGRKGLTVNSSLATSFGDSRIAWNRPSETESGPLFMVMTALQVSIIVSTHVIGTHSPHFFFCDQTSSDRNSLLA